MNLLRIPTAVVAVAALAITAPAHATPPVGVSAVARSKQTIDGKDYIVEAGTLTHYGSDCRRDGVYGIGTPITDPTGAEHVHLGRNEGTTPVVLRVTYVDPAGAPTSDSAPDPGCSVE